MSAAAAISCAACTAPDDAGTGNGVAEESRDMQLAAAWVGDDSGVGVMCTGCRGAGASMMGGGCPVVGC